MMQLVFFFLNLYYFDFNTCVLIVCWGYLQNGDTALFLAVKNRYLIVVQQLLQYSEINGNLQDCVKF